MLKLVQRQDWDAQFAYAPPLVDAVINLDEVVEVVPTESRGPGPRVLVRFRGGNTCICRGEPADFLPVDRESSADAGLA